MLQVFYRITGPCDRIPVRLTCAGGLFNPAITIALWLCGAVSSLRAVILIVAQYAGGIAAAGLVACMTPCVALSSSNKK